MSLFGYFSREIARLDSLLRERDAKIADLRTVRSQYQEWEIEARAKIAKLERELADKHESLKVFADKLIAAGMQHARDKEAAARWKWCEENAGINLLTCLFRVGTASDAKDFAAAVDAAIKQLESK